MTKSISLVFLFALSFYGIAQAQNSSLEIGDIPRKERASEAGPAPTGASALNENELNLNPNHPPARWVSYLTSENSLYQTDRDQFNSGAPLNSDNSISLMRNLSPKLSLGFMQYFETVTHRENLHAGSNSSILHAQNGTEPLAFNLRAFFRPGWTLLNSKPLLIEARYGLPTDRLSHAVRSPGTWRSDVSAEWVFTPRIVLDWVESLRLKFNSAQNPDSEMGSDTAHRLVSEPMLAYNFSDSFGVYYGPFFDQTSRGVQRGAWRADMSNTLRHEIGINYTQGPVYLNPAVDSESSLDNSEAGLFTADSRVFSHETLSYWMSVIVTY